MFCSKREALIVKVLMSLKSFTWALSDGIGIYFSEDELQWDFSLLPVKKNCPILPNSLFKTLQYLIMAPVMLQMFPCYKSFCSPQIDLFWLSLQAWGSDYVQLFKMKKGRKIADNHIDLCCKNTNFLIFYPLYHSAFPGVSRFGNRWLIPL